ncbi:MAG: divalent-cation tolerance protein CutA [Candidatus Omnitrophica bacterium]|nr:divalent-cation tolerance protein CutA [Candidatus Omnitrophota bacterium]
MSGVSVVLITAATPDEGRRIARTLVEERLAACVNVMDSAHSIYRWQERVEDSTETLLLAKTRSALFEKLSCRVSELHSYECPEVVRLSVEDGSAPYLDWVRKNTQEQ